MVQEINILTVNGLDFHLEDGSWGLIRASSNKPSLVVVTESPNQIKEKKKYFILLINCYKKLEKLVNMIKKYNSINTIKISFKYIKMNSL